MVSPPNENEIDFKISFDESDDEDYMVIFDENSFCYKIISVDNLKMESENKNDKVNKPTSPEPAISHSNNLDFFINFENEFLTITYNDDLASKLTEPYVSFQHIEEFDNETSLSKYDEEARNVLYFNDSFPPNNLKSKKDIDDDEIDVTQSSGRNAINIDTKGSDKLLKTGGGHLTGVDLFYLRNMDQWTANVPYLWHNTCLGMLRGGRVELGCLGLSLIGLHELERLNIYERIGDTWAWVAPRLERQSDVAAGAPRATKDAPAVDEDAQANPAPVQAPQTSPPSPRTMP
nr:hypothetical protein [Tanacetum cinerariifolium]